MDKFKNKYRIPSTRAKWHSYDGGLYFITICTKNRQHYLGSIKNSEMHLSKIGQYINESIEAVTDHYPFAEIPLFVIMPNHLHLIVSITADDDDDCRDVINHASTTGGITGANNPMLHKNLARIIRWLKGRVSYVARQHNPSFAWQSRFYDRIIRNQEECNRIATYIENNVVQWELDSYYSQHP